MLLRYCVSSSECCRQRVRTIIHTQDNDWPVDCVRPMPRVQLPKLLGGAFTPVGIAPYVLLGRSCAQGLRYSGAILMAQIWGTGERSYARGKTIFVCGIVLWKYGVGGARRQSRA